MERVIAALCHAKHDRLPRYGILLDNFINKWRREKQAGENADIYNTYSVDISRESRLAVQQGPFMNQVLKKRIPITGMSGIAGPG